MSFCSWMAFPTLDPRLPRVVRLQRHDLGPQDDPGFSIRSGTLAEGVDDLGMQSSEAIEVGPVYRVTGTATRRLDEAWALTSEPGRGAR